MPKNFPNADLIWPWFKKLIGRDAPQKLTAAEVELKKLCLAFGPDGVALFDSHFYTETYPDIAGARIDPFLHYLQTGWSEGRQPSSAFDGQAYLAANPDVQAAGLNPLVHFVKNGFAEGRPLTLSGQPDAAVAALFDREFYLERYPDVAAGGVNPLRHYLDSGWRENRDPSPHFSTMFYLAAYEEVRNSGLDPLTHFVVKGQKMGYVAQTAAVPISTALTDKAAAAKTALRDADAALPAVPLLSDLHFAGHKGAGLVIDTLRNGIIKGAAIAPDQATAQLDILVDGHTVDSVMCDLNYAGAGTGADSGGGREAMPRKSGFEARLPVRWKYVSPNGVAVRFHRKTSTRRMLPWAGRAHPRVLIIANAASATDGSRIYRAELPAIQLRASGVEVVVLAQEAAFAGIETGHLPLDTFDIVIFQRVPLTNTSQNVLNKARAQGTRVLYDVDDLMFKPWRRAEMGVIRSGTVRFDDKAYEDSLRKRLHLIMQCDAVICSTPFLQRELNSLGVPAILSRNAVDNEHFRYGALRLAQPQTDRFRMMFMSGTATHDADFRPIMSEVHTLLERNPSASLTILGELKVLGLEDLPNVERRPVVPRAQMFELVSQHDVVLVPLERTAFNTAKSSLKFMECGAAGVPVIASDLFEFRRDITASGAGMIARKQADWGVALQRYIDDRALSRAHGLKAFQYCRANYSVASRKDYLWDEICRFDDYLIALTHRADQIDRKLAQV